MDTKYLEVFIILAGMAFSPFAIPIMTLIIYLISLVYFRSGEDVSDGIDLLYKSLGYTGIYLLWVMISLAVTIILKKILYRDRPNPIKTSRLLELRWNEHNGAFPSGDTLQSAVFVGYILLNFQLQGTQFYWQLTLIGLVPFVAFARVYFHCHWIGDTIAGGIIGF
mmetsp:Transcript_152/g.141  ORF Transcript_152/g.141 Transcript_152/m.141 type:complete len:166 (+) Transcript_152:66-563(+)